MYFLCSPADFWDSARANVLVHWVLSTWLKLMVCSVLFGICSDFGTTGDADFNEGVDIHESWIGCINRVEASAGSAETVENLVSLKARQYELIMTADFAIEQLSLLPDGACCSVVIGDCTNSTLRQLSALDATCRSMVVSIEMADKFITDVDIRPFPSIRRVEIIPNGDEDGSESIQGQWCVVQDAPLAELYLQMDDLTFLQHLTRPISTRSVEISYATDADLDMDGTFIGVETMVFRNCSSIRIDVTGAELSNLQFISSLHFSVSSKNPLHLTRGLHLICCNFFLLDITITAHSLHCSDVAAIVRLLSYQPLRFVSIGMSVDTSTESILRIPRTVKVSGGLSSSSAVAHFCLNRCLVQNETPDYVGMFQWQQSPDSDVIPRILFECPSQLALKLSWWQCRISVEEQERLIRMMLDVEMERGIRLSWHNILNEHFDAGPFEHVLMERPEIVNQTFGPNATTLLHKFANKEDFVRVLLTHGADPIAMDLDGRTPRDVARRNRLTRALLTEAAEAQH